MRIIRLTLTFIATFVCSVLVAQNLSVESFRLLETDLTANTYGTQERDQNGEVAALIKVVTSETGFVFDGGMMGIVKTVQKTGEIWVYVPRAIQKITITHQQYGVLRDYYFPINIDRARTYEMVLKLPYTAPVSSRTRAQYVVFNVEPQNAVVLVDNEAHTLNSEGQLSLRLNPGEHTYMVTAPSYETETGTVTVRDSRVTKNINLSSLIGQLIVNTDNDALLYINDEFKGYGTWSGSLNEGIYYVEVRRPSYRTVYQEVSIRRSDNRVVTLRATEPAYGDVEVVSDPLDFDIYIDGEKQGVTPDFITFVRVGTHLITLKKENYYDREVMVDVLEDSVAYVSVTDLQRIPESAKDKKKREAQEAKAAKEAAKAEAKAAKQAERDASRQEEQQSAQEEVAQEELNEEIQQDFQENKAKFTDVYEVADVMPVYPSGNTALIQYFKNNFACPQYYQGNDRVVVAFIVEKDGYVSNPYVVKGIDEQIDREAIRVVNQMPKWTPGIKDGRIVRVWQTVNINIRNKETSSAYVADGNVELSGDGSAKRNKRSSKGTTWYAGGMFTPLGLESYGVEAGFYASHFNMELDYTLYNKKFEGSWPKSEVPLYTRVYDYTRKYDYKWKFDNTLSLRMGFGINIGRVLRLTPQVGGVMTTLKAIDDELIVIELDKGRKAYYFGAQAAAKVELNLSEHVSLFALPMYTYPIKLDDTATRLDQNSGLIKSSLDGFHLGAGINILF